MPLTQDELREVFKQYTRFTTDAAQGMTYCLDSKYLEGITNFLAAIRTLESIVEEIKS